MDQFNQREPGIKSGSLELNPYHLLYFVWIFIKIKSVYSYFA